MVKISKEPGDHEQPRQKMIRKWFVDIERSGETIRLEGEVLIENSKRKTGKSQEKPSIGDWRKQEEK